MMRSNLYGLTRSFLRDCDMGRATICAMNKKARLPMAVGTLLQFHTSSDPDPRCRAPNTMVPMMPATWSVHAADQEDVTGT